MQYNTAQYNINFGFDQPVSTRVKKGILFAGGDGWGLGTKKFKDQIDIRWILNHWDKAIKTCAFHNKETKVYFADIYLQDEKEMEEVDILQASIECDQHTGASAGKEKELGAYMMGWELVRYLPHLNPAVIIIENVPEYKKWAPVDERNQPIKERQGEEFERWKRTIMAMGYEYKESIRNAADDGLPTRRVRFFCYFYRVGIQISFPEPTHSDGGCKPNTKKWKPCRPYIDTDNHGTSIFGRKYNTSLAKHQRKAYCNNSLRRIAWGIKKQYPDFYQFLAKYHAGINPERSQSLDSPLATIDTSNRHQLVTVEGGQFIQDHCQTDHYQSLDQPMKTQLTWQTKQLVTLEKLQFLMDHCHSDKSQGLDEPMQVQTSRQTKQLVSIEADDSFITQYYGSGLQYNSLDKPLHTITCRDTHQLVRVEKMQFIVKYFNAWNNPESQSQSLDDPLSTIMTVAKHQLVTLLDDFDIKARFLNAEELGTITTFPKGYFSHPDLKISQKDAIKLIGNAVPPEWAEKLLKPNIESIVQYVRKKRQAVA